MTYELMRNRRRRRRREGVQNQSQKTIAEKGTGCFSLGPAFVTVWCLYLHLSLCHVNAKLCHVIQYHHRLLDSQLKPAHPHLWPGGSHRVYTLQKQNTFINIDNTIIHIILSFAIFIINIKHLYMELLEPTCIHEIIRYYHSQAYRIKCSCLLNNTTHK